MAAAPGRRYKHPAKTNIQHAINDEKTNIQHAINDELLHCKVCYTRFSAESPPKLLACSHTFCEPCMVKHHQINSEKKLTSLGKKEFPCPLCRKCTSLPTGGIEQLTNNFTVLSLLEILDEKNSGARRGAGGRCEATEHCIKCGKPYPESTFPCGHCICSVCTDEETLYRDEVTCPRGCASDTSFKDTDSELSFYSSNGNGVLQGSNAQTTPISNQRGLHLNLSNNSLSGRAASGRQITREVAGTAPSLSNTDISISHPGTYTNSSLQTSATNSPSRPPPYNPSCLAKALLERVNTSMPSIHSTPASRSQSEMGYHSLRSTNSPAHSLSSSRISQPLQETPYGTLRRQETPYGTLRRQETPLNLQETRYNSPQQQHVDTQSTIFEGNFLRRSASMCRPPVPPRRNFSAPGSYSSLQRRSASGPGSNNKANDTYQSPTDLYGIIPPVPPRRRLFDSPKASPVKCVKKFGCYSDTHMQTSTFKQPSKVGLSDQGDIVVVDTQQMTVQVFTIGGDYLTMFKVIGVQGASFFSPDRLAIATHQGVDVYTISGEKLKQLHSGLIVNTAPFKFGFLAATPRTILIYRQSLVLAKEITKRKTSRNFLRKKSSSFDNIKDVTMTTNKLIAVLDAAKSVIFIIDEEGHHKQTIDPALESCGSLKQPESITADQSNYLYVSDTGNQRVLRFSHTGAYSQCVLNCRIFAADRHLAPYGITVTKQGHLVVVLAGDKAAEVRIYQMS